MATFEPPVVFNQPRVLPTTKGPARALWSHYSARPVGQSVLKTNGVYATVQNPTVDQCAAASEVYLGGHIYEISAAVEAALIAAGYGAYIT